MTAIAHIASTHIALSWVLIASLSEGSTVATGHAVAAASEGTMHVSHVSRPMFSGVVADCSLRRLVALPAPDGDVKASAACPGRRSKVSCT